MTTSKTLHGPGGLTLTLDKAEVYEDDPGQGTPALLTLGREAGTLWCAADTGCCGEADLTDAQREWVGAQVDAANEFLYGS